MYGGDAAGLTSMAVIVRRVVEARKLTLSGGPPAANTGPRTLLEPLNEKHMHNIDPEAIKRRNENPTFWSKLRCW
jgi:hypothetical protein